MSHWSVEIEAPIELSDWLSWLIAERLDVAVEIQDDETLTSGPEPDLSRIIVRSEEEPDELWIKQIRECMIEVGSKDCPIRTSKTNDDEWKLGWRAFFNETEVAEGVIIRPPWTEPSTVEGVIEIIIDPGLAFGTGTHPTTQIASQLCLSALSGRAPCRVLDQGCGSGILSFLVAKLGHRAKGVEIDPTAIKNAHENATLNGINASQVEFISHYEVPEEVFDVVVANMITPILIDLAPTLMKATSDLIILSGIRLEQESKLFETYSEWEVVERVTLDEWVGCTLRRKEGGPS
jgi:ribosomal protein L11 methyltransferase